MRKNLDDISLQDLEKLIQIKKCGYNLSELTAFSHDFTNPNILKDSLSVFNSSQIVFNSVPSNQSNTLLNALKDLQKTNESLENKLVEHSEKISMLKSS